MFCKIHDKEYLKENFFLEDSFWYLDEDQAIKNHTDVVYEYMDEDLTGEIVDLSLISNGEYIEEFIEYYLYIEDYPEYYL